MLSCGVGPAPTEGGDGRFGFIGMRQVGIDKARIMRKEAEGECQKKSPEKTAAHFVF